MEKISLNFPVSVGNEVVSELTMRRPKVRDQIAANHQTKDAAEQEITLFANLCEVTPDTIREMDMKDYRELQRVYSGFLS